MTPTRRTTIDESTAKKTALLFPHMAKAEESQQLEGDEFADAPEWAKELSASVEELKAAEADGPEIDTRTAQKAAAIFPHQVARLKEASENGEDVDLVEAGLAKRSEAERREAIGDLMSTDRMRQKGRINARGGRR